MTRNPNARFRDVLGGSLMVLAMLLGVGKASAVEACAAYDMMSEQLERRYAETPVAGGLAQDKLLEVFATKDGSTWTVVLTRPDGRSCIVAAGQHWWTKVPKPGPRV